MDGYHTNQDGQDVYKRQDLEQQLQKRMNSAL